MPALLTTPPRYYLWDANQTNQSPLDPSLLSDGYPNSAIPRSFEFNELMNDVTQRLQLLEVGAQSLTIENAVFDTSVTQGMAVYWNSGAITPSFFPAIADGSAAQNVLGFADVTNGRIFISGYSNVRVGLTAGTIYYLSTTLAGSVQAFPPTSNIIILGFAKSTTELYLNINKLSDSAWITGDLKPIAGFNATPPAGWLNFESGSIGNAASSATLRANADTEALFTYVWNRTVDANCPVLPGGRGLTAAADFAADKTIGWTTNGRTLVNGYSTYQGLAAFGEATHALTAAENGPHAHTLSTLPARGGVRGPYKDPTDNQSSAALEVTQVSGAGTPHNNIQPSFSAFYLIKL